jgi:hypothetical protein
MPPSLARAGEALSYVQGESLKGSAAVFWRLSNSPVTSASRWWPLAEPGVKLDTQTPKKIKMPLDYALLKLHDAMELVFDYDHDRNFVPSADQLVLFALLHEQIIGYEAMLLIIVKEMHERAKTAIEAEAVHLARPSSK